MLTLYIIRHAESEANKKRILASQLAYPLTNDGKADASCIAAELSDIAQIHRIISSPLLRARQTAAAFEKVFGIVATEDNRIVEQHLGLFAGLSYDEVKSHSSYETNTFNRWDWVPEGGGESYSMMADRVQSFFASLEKTRDTENVLIVTHAVVFRIIRGLLKNTLPKYQKEFPNNGEIWKVPFLGLGHTHEIESIFLGNSAQFVHNP